MSSLNADFKGLCLLIKRHRMNPPSNGKNRLGIFVFRDDTSANKDGPKNTPYKKRTMGRSFHLRIRPCKSNCVTAQTSISYRGLKMKDEHTHGREET